MKPYQKPRLVTYRNLCLSPMTAQSLTALNFCGAEGEPGGDLESFDCEGSLVGTDTGEFAFCTVGISDGSQLDGYVVTIIFPPGVQNPDCPDSDSATLANCASAPQFQAKCDPFGGGLPVVCTATLACSTIECAAGTFGATGGFLTSPGGQRIDCLGTPE